MNLEQEPIYVNKLTRIFAYIIIGFMLVCAICAYNGCNSNATPDTTTESTDIVVDTTSVEETTVPEETTHEETFELPEITMPETTTYIPPVVESYLTLTESERLILATLIRLECGGSSYETQMAVASVVVNRMNLWGLSLRQAVFQKNVFSPASLIDQETGHSYYNPPKTGAYAQCWQVVDDICANGPTIPYYVIYFRSGHYHSWAIPYAKIGSLYFSYVDKYK